MDRQKSKTAYRHGQRFDVTVRESGAKLEDLEAIVLTHLHIDHVVDLPSYIKAGYFTSRTKPLPILGPIGNQHFPSTDEFIETLFGDKGGGVPLYVRRLDTAK